jgi:hypothetical protein
MPGQNVERSVGITGSDSERDTTARRYSGLYVVANLVLLGVLAVLIYALAKVA